MTDHAARTLARAWQRGDRAWWTATALATAGALTVLVLVVALFDGMEAETTERVADFYTHDARVTKHGAAVIPSGDFSAEERQALGASVGHLESQFVLSRRGFVEAAVFEEEGFDFEQTGTAGDARKDILLGVLVGVPFDEPAATARLERYRVAGDWPAHVEGEAIPLVMSVERLGALLTADEKANLSAWPPPIAEVQALRLEVTAAVLVEGGGDVIRRPARVAALYETGLQELDSLTILAPVESVRVLRGHGPDDAVWNVLLLDDAAAARAAGWHVETPTDFTERFLGQLMDLVRGMGVTLASFLFVLPALLVGHGITRQLAAHARPLAVAHAIGVASATIRRAMVRVVTRATFLGFAVAAVVVAVAVAALHAWLPTLTATPLPMDVRVRPLTIALALAVVAASAALATALAMRGQRRLDLPTVLRAE